MCVAGTAAAVTVATMRISYPHLAARRRRFRLTVAAATAMFVLLTATTAGAQDPGDLGLVPAPEHSSIGDCDFTYEPDGSAHCTGTQGQLCRWEPHEGHQGWGTESCVFADPGPAPTSPPGDLSAGPPRTELPRTGATSVAVVAAAALVAVGGCLHRASTARRCRAATDATGPGRRG